MINFFRRLMCLGTLVFFLFVQSTNPQSPTKPAEPLALVNVTVIDGNGGPPKPRMTLVISGDYIADMFATGSKKLPDGAQVMDMSNHYVIPGLIDSHYHFMLGLRSKEAEEALRRYAFLGGVTTVRDMAGDAIALAELARLASDKAVQSPRVYYSALMAGATHLLNDKRVDAVSHGRPRGEAPWVKAITPQTDIAKAVREAKATGATGIKIYTDLTPEMVATLTAEAHKQGLKVWSHAAIYPGRPSDAVRAGVDVISHSNLIIVEAMDKVPPRYSGSYPLLDYNSYGVESKAVSALLQLMLERGTFLDPTLVVTSRLEKTEPGNIFQDPARMAEWSYQFTTRAHIRKIPIVVGTDVNESPTTHDFPNIHAEMELLVTKVGLTPLEAITAATRNGAQVLGISKSFGTIAPGKVADMVVLSADPSADIRNTTKIVYVIKGGKLHKRDSATALKGSGDTPTARELRDLVLKWDEANVKGDVAALDSLLADEFTFVGGPNKAQYLESIKSRSSDLTVESAVSTDIEVQIYGDTAIVVGLDTIKGVNRGQAYVNKYLYMDVWIKRSGRWQCVKVLSTPGR
jgi:imidazolonepropionase-like amidohydrolase/ketosteroid isomerase-like protein